jgi:hypothetical protein
MATKKKNKVDKKSKKSAAIESLVEEILNDVAEGCMCDVKKEVDLYMQVNKLDSLTAKNPEHRVMLNDIVKDSSIKYLSSKSNEYLTKFEKLLKNKEESEQMICDIAVLLKNGMNQTVYGEDEVYHVKTE